MPNDLFEFEREALIDATGGYWLTTLNDGRKKLIIQKVAGVFNQWRTNHVIKNVPAGILSAALDPKSWKAYQDAKLQHDDILLAFDLWLKGNSAFKELTDKHGLYRIFAVIGHHVHKDVSVSSLVRLAAFLAEPLNALAKYVAKSASETEIPSKPTTAQRARAEQLASARPNAKSTLEEHTKTIKKGVKDWLIAELKGNPDLIAKTATHRILKLNWARGVNGKLLGYHHVYRRLVCPALQELKSQR